MSIEVVVALITCVVSVGLVLFNGGRQAGRVEAAIKRLESIEKNLEAVPELKVKVGVTEEAILRMRSDHRELAATVDRIRDRFPSQVDEHER